MNVHLYQSVLTNESRILKETKSLVESGLVAECLVIGYWEEGLRETESVGPGRTFVRLKLYLKRANAGRILRALYLVEWGVRVLFKLYHRNISIITVHSVLTLPIGAFLKGLCRSKLVYDCHELETERNGLKGIAQWFVRILERSFIRFADAIILVNQSIEEWYIDAYGDLVRGRTVAVRNVPDQSPRSRRTQEGMRKALGIPTGEMLFIYQGLVSPGRGIDRLLRVFAGRARDKHVVFMGYGSLEAEIRAWASRHPNIHFYPSVPPQEVLAYTSEADVGLCVLEEVCLSYRYALPNKVFEYLLGGLPVIVNDFPTVGSLIDQYGCGWKVAATDEALEALLSSINWENWKRKRELVTATQHSFSWKQEQKKLLAIYAPLTTGVKYVEATI